MKTDRQLIQILQKELRDLEEENTELRKKVNKPPSPSMQQEFERLSFEMRRLRTEVERAERKMREYQKRMRELVDTHYDIHKRRPPTGP